MTLVENLQCSINAAQRDLDRRRAQGEDVSHLYVCKRTAQIKVSKFPRKAKGLSARYLRTDYAIAKYGSKAPA